jgi:hypothetical protein
VRVAYGSDIQPRESAKTPVAIDAAAEIAIAQSAQIIPHNARDVLLASYSSVHHFGIVDSACLPDTTEKPHLIFIRAIDEQATYLVSLPIETPREGIAGSSNGLPALSMVSYNAGYSPVTGRSGVEIIHQTVASSRVVSNIIQVIPVLYLTRRKSAAHHTCNQGYHHQKDGGSCNITLCSGTKYHVRVGFLNYTDLNCPSTDFMSSILQELFNM